MQGSAIDETKTSLNYHPEVAETHGHEEHPDLRMTGVVVFLIAETMIFLGMFGAFLIYRTLFPVWPPNGIERELLLPSINTIILISSSFVMHRGQSAIKNNDNKGLQLWFTITAIMGAIFLGGQLFEYSSAEFSLTTNVFASAFYVLTGFHGLHVTVGLLLILAVLFRSREAGHYNAEEHFGVEAAEIYWHFVDVVWVVLFILVYLL